MCVCVCFPRTIPKSCLCFFFSPDFFGAEKWEGDERRRFHFIESGVSLNGQNLFSELFFAECLSFSEKALLFADFCFVASPSPSSAPTFLPCSEL